MKYGQRRIKTGPHIHHPYYTLGIYKKRRHILVMFGFLTVPFLFFIFFSKLVRIDTSDLFVNLGTSFLRIIIAYAISATLGFVLAVMLYRGKAGTFFLPVFDVLQSFPTFAALPLALLFWGTSNFTVIFFLIVAMIWPIFFMTLSSLKLIRNEWYEVVEISGLRGFSYMRQFIFPAAVPALITGSIVGIGEGWEALIATEIIVGLRYGLGPFFQSFSTDTQVTIFGILGLLILIFSINKLIWLPLLESSHRNHEE